MFWLPSLLFCVLVSVFSSASFVLYQKEIERRTSLASAVAEQVSTSLEVFSADRKRALKDLVLSWPSRHPNPIDWFHTHASNIKNMLPGIADIWWVSEQFTIRWNIAKTRQGNLVGVHLSEFYFDVNELADTGSGNSLQSGRSLRSFYAMRVDPNDHGQGYVVIEFNIQNTLNSLIGDLTGPQFNVLIKDKATELFSHGYLIPDRTLVNLPFSFGDRQWQLWLQSRPQNLPMSLLIFAIGVLMSALICLVFYWQLKGALRLSRSQGHYKAASDASIDSILIYESLSNSQNETIDFRLVDANKVAKKRFKCDYDNPLNFQLSHQLSLLKLTYMLPELIKVNQSGNPYEQTIENTSDVFNASWLKIQAVKADNGLGLTIRDISSRQLSEQRLKNSEARFRRLVDGLNRDFIYSLDANTNLQFVSTSVTNILGYDVEDFIQNSTQYLVAEPDNIATIRELQKAGKKSSPYIVSYRSAQQKIISIEFNDSPVFNEAAQLIAIEGIGRDVTEDLVLKQKIYYQANHDPLTGLLNRYAFDKKLRHSIEQVPANWPRATLCYIDMDKFKLVNDTCGHQAGDELLRTVANLIKQHLTPSDMLARVGGDEFCLILPSLEDGEVKSMIQAILDSIAALRFEWNGRVFHIGASVGLVVMDKANLNAVELVKAADTACYTAKDNGRNNYVYHEHNRSSIVFKNNELHVLSQVQTALANDGFTLFFQTIKALDETTDTGLNYEVLLRMFDKTGEAISPATFIPVAERHGLMTLVDEWVFNTTLAMLEAHPEHVAALSKCAINLSGASLNSQSFMRNLLETLQKTQVPLSKLCIEITETSAVTNLIKASSYIDEIRRLGCRFSLDDFGAGMSSFMYLKNMQVDFIKIDGSFVRNMCDDPCDIATVKAINDIAHSMNKQTIAEFVSDKATEAMLRDIGVNYAQGFGIAEPMPLKAYLT